MLITKYLVKIDVNSAMGRFEHKTWEDHGKTSMHVKVIKNKTKLY